LLIFSILVKFNTKAHQLKCQDSGGRCDVDAADSTKLVIGENFSLSGKII
jgi:hypothetical protein